MKGPGAQHTYQVYRGKSMSDFTADNFNIPTTDNHKLGFFAGSYDYSGYTALGAKLEVKLFQITGITK